MEWVLEEANVLLSIIVFHIVWQTDAGLVFIPPLFPAAIWTRALSGNTSYCIHAFTEVDAHEARQSSEPMWLWTFPSQCCPALYCPSTHPTTHITQAYTVMDLQASDWAFLVTDGRRCTCGAMPSWCAPPIRCFKGQESISDSAS